MRRLLFLSHRIPYPPNKGDKIRSYHIFKYLAERYEVYLGTFVDDERDWRYVPTLRDMCKDSQFSALRRRRAAVRGLGAFLSGGALSVHYYADTALRQWVDDLLSVGQIERIVVFSSVMAQYVSSAPVSATSKLVDFVDIDSDKWLQYSASVRWPKSWVYRHEAQMLGRYERDVARSCDASLFVSEAEADLFRGQVPDVGGRVHYMDNGVDADYFSPARPYPNPYNPGQKVIVFTGAMDYWPNVEAVRWFVNEVLPYIRQSRPDACFCIVGSRPTPAVRALAEFTNVQVTGTVEDVRPYLAHAHVAVAPLRISRGVQNKVLEAMAMAKPVVATSKALEGISTDSKLRGTDAPSEFAERVLEWLDAAAGVDSSIPSVREHVVQRYDWQANLELLDVLLEGGITSRCVA